MKPISRKAFLIGGATAAATAGACLCTKTGRATLSGVGATPSIPAEAYRLEAENRIRIDLDKVPQLARVGGSVKIVDANIPAALIVVRKGEDSYLAASIRCTHRGVEVEYRPEDGCFQCASLGGSRFRLDGETLSGLAKEPLKRYPAVRQDKTLVVRLA